MSETCTPVEREYIEAVFDLDGPDGMPQCEVAPKRERYLKALAAMREERKPKDPRDVFVEEVRAALNEHDLQGGYKINRCWHAIWKLDAAARKETKP